MKKILSAVLFLFIFAPSVFAGVAVSRVQGEVLLVHPGGQSQPAQKGAIMSEGDALKISEGASADVSLHENAGFRFMPGTQMVFTKIDPKKTSLSLENGNLIARFKEKIPIDATFEIETPTAVLAVRGTQFWGRVASPGEKPVTSFAVREGSVRITSKLDKQNYNLLKGQAIELPKDGPAVRRDATPAEIAAIRQSEEIEFA